MIVLNKFGAKILSHTLSGIKHIGQLSDNQVPDYITRDSELITTSGTLYDQIVGLGDIDIDGGNFV